MNAIFYMVVHFNEIDTLEISNGAATLVILEVGYLSHQIGAHDEELVSDENAQKEPLTIGRSLTPSLL